MLITWQHFKAIIRVYFNESKFIDSIIHFLCQYINIFAYSNILYTHPRFFKGHTSTIRMIIIIITHTIQIKDLQSKSYKTDQVFLIKIASPPLKFFFISFPRSKLLILIGFHLLFNVCYSICI